MLLPHRFLLLLYRFPGELDFRGIPVGWVSGEGANCGLGITKSALAIIVEHSGDFPSTRLELG